MIIKTLVENTSISDDFGYEHGLSLYIETKKHKIIFDLGSEKLFEENAMKMNVDLSDIDIVVISHGHSDHGGGIRQFLSLNTKAKIYFNKLAFEKYYINKTNGEKKYIGLDRSLIQNDRFVFTGDNFIIDEELELFSNVKGNRIKPSNNQNLLMMVGDSYINDEFNHEQNLIIRDDKKILLLIGCAHNGVINILEYFNILKGGFPSVVIGGFHLYGNSSGKVEDSSIVAEIGEYLLSTKSKYYTCHCTGLEPFKQLKFQMGEYISYLSCGSQILL